MVQTFVGTDILRQMLKYGVDADVMIVTSEKEGIKAHSAVLKTASPIFEDKLATSPMKVTPIEPPAYRQILSGLTGLLTRGKKARSSLMPGLSTTIIDMNDLPSNIAKALINIIYGHDYDSQAYGTHLSPAEFHLTMYELGLKYDMPGLNTVATLSFRDVIMYQQKSPAQTAAIIKRVYAMDATKNRDLREVVIASLFEKPDPIYEWKDIKAAEKVLSEIKDVLMVDGSLFPAPPRASSVDRQPGCSLDFALNKCPKQGSKHDSRSPPLVTDTVGYCSSCGVVMWDIAVPATG